MKHTQKKSHNSPEVLLHLLMCFIGGFLGAYAMLIRGNQFGSAQSANLIHLFLSLPEGHWSEALLRLAGLLIYIAAILAAWLLPKYIKSDMRRVCIFIEGAGIILTSLLPAHMNPLLALLPIFAVTAFQWSIFSGAQGYSCSTIFSTNNVRQATVSWAEYIRTKDSEQKKKAVFYSKTLLIFHVGVISGWFFVRCLNVYSALICLIPLTIAYVNIVLCKNPESNI